VAEGLEMGVREKETVVSRAVATLLVRLDQKGNPEYGFLSLICIPV